MMREDGHARTGLVSEGDLSTLHHKRELAVDGVGILSSLLSCHCV